MGEIIRLDDVRREYEAARRCEAEAKNWDARTARILERFAATTRARAATRAQANGSDGREPIACPWDE